MDKIKEVLGYNFYNHLLEIKDNNKLDRTIFGYFDRCFKANEVLTRYNIFSLNFSSAVICLGFLYRKRFRENIN